MTDISTESVVNEISTKSDVDQWDLNHICFGWDLNQNRSGWDLNQICSGWDLNQTRTAEILTKFVLNEVSNKSVRETGLNQICSEWDLNSFWMRIDDISAKYVIAGEIIMAIDLFNNDVKCGKRDVARWLVRNITFSSLDVIIKKVI